MSALVSGGDAACRGLWLSFEQCERARGTAAAVWRLSVTRRPRHLVSRRPRPASIPRRVTELRRPPATQDSRICIRFVSTSV